MSRLLDRSFTRREKGLLLVLAVILVSCCYYLLVWEPSATAEQSARAELAEVDDQLVMEEAVAAQRAQIQTEIDEAKGRGVTARTLPEQDNTKGIMTELNTVLAPCEAFDVSFEGAEESGSVVRRTVRVSYSCKSVAYAEKILRALMDSSYSSMVTDFAFSQEGATAFSSEPGGVTASALVTYFEASPSMAASASGA